MEPSISVRPYADEGLVVMEPYSGYHVRPCFNRESTYYTPSGSADYEQVPIYEDIDQIRVDPTYVDEAPVTSL